MADFYDDWQRFCDRLIGTGVIADGSYARGRDRLLGALTAFGVTCEDAELLDEDQLRARPGHHLAIIASDGAPDDLDFVVIPDDELDDEMRAGLARLDGATIRAVGTPEEDPDQWRAWVMLVLATGARDRDDVGVPGEDLPLDDDLVAAISGRWVDRLFAPRPGRRLDGDPLNVRLTGITAVLERV